MTRKSATDLTRAAARAVISHLGDLSGFDGWWGGIDRAVQREIRADLAKAIQKATRIDATHAVLAERERELLELKGPCSSTGCPLHYAHSGPCDIRPAGDEGKPTP